MNQDHLVAFVIVAVLLLTFATWLISSFRAEAKRLDKVLQEVAFNASVEEALDLNREK